MSFVVIILGKVHLMCTICMLYQLRGNKRGCEELSSACSFSLLKFIWRSLLRLYKHLLLWLHAEFCRPVLFLVFPCCEVLGYLHGGLPRALPSSTQESFFTAFLSLYTYFLLFLKWKKWIKEVFIKVFLTFVKNEEMLSRGYEFKVHI